MERPNYDDYMYPDEYIEALEKYIDYLEEQLRPL